MRTQDAWRATLRTVQLCPALPLAVTVAVGQLLMWFLRMPEAALLSMVMGGALVCTTGLARVVSVGLLCGLLSAACSIMGRSGVLSAEDVAFQGRIVQDPRHPKTGEVVFTVRAHSIAGGPPIRCRAVELPWRNSVDLKEGDMLWLRGKMTNAHRPLNPFSWEGWLYRRGIVGELKVRWLSRPQRGEMGLCARAREEVESIVIARYGERRGGALFLSMAFGFQDRLSSYLEGAFKRVGLTHLLVVSGYQVSLVFLVISWTLTRCSLYVLRGGNTRVFVPLVSLLASSMYVLFVGLEASALRALLAAGCVCASVVGERGSRFLQRWAVSLLIIQILMPWSVCDIGVQLTFAALGGIGVGVTLGKGRSVPTYGYIALSTWLFTGCVLAAWGGSLAPAGILFNIVLATPWSVLNCVLGSVGFLLLALCGEWGAGVLDLVVVLNELLADWMVSASDGLVGQAYQPRGLQQLMTFAVLAILGVSLCVCASRRSRSAMMRELVR